MKRLLEEGACENFGVHVGGQGMGQGRQVILVMWIR